MLRVTKWAEMPVTPLLRSFPNRASLRVDPSSARDLIDFFFFSPFVRREDFCRPMVLAAGGGRSGGASGAYEEYACDN